MKAGHKTKSAAPQKYCAADLHVFSNSAFEEAAH